MPKITRKHQKILGENSSQTGIFGNAQKGIYDQLSNDPDLIQSDVWEQGWNSATFSGSKLPVLEEIQGVDYVTTRQISYIMQEGIPEYSPDTTYYDSSLVKAVGTVIVYRSLSNDNKGNPLSDSNNWRMVCNFDTVQPLNNYDSVVDPTPNDDESLGYSAGSYWYNTVSENTFFCVNSDIGSAVWVLQSSISPEDLTASIVKALNTNGLSSSNVQGQLDQLANGNRYESFPIGVPIPVWDHISGVVPPSNSGNAKFIRLTANQDGAGQYNEGLVDPLSETITGTGPTIVATVDIDYAASPIDGETIYLINTMGTVLRAEETSGVFKQDQMQLITGRLNTSVAYGQMATSPPEGALTRDENGSSTAIGTNSTTTRGSFVFDSSLSPNARTGDRTQDKSLSVTYYMRIA